MLQQSYRHIEVLILDNNSSDETVRVIQNFDDVRIKLFCKKENLGAYGGLNFLLEKAAGDFMAVQDHDDLWHPQKLTLQIKVLEERKDILACGANHIEFFEKEQIYYAKQQPEFFYRTFHPSILFRKTKKRYDTSIIFACDVNFMTNILCEKEKKIYNVQQVLVAHRRRNDSKNLSEQWKKNISWQYIKNFHAVSDSWLTTFKFIVKEVFLPKSIRRKIELNAFEVKTIASMKNDAHLLPFYKYLEHETV